MILENQIVLGNCLDVLKTLPDNSVDSCVTDPPYGYKFMGKKWDHSVPSVEVWKEIMRVLKPGVHLIAACGTRTQHRMAVNIEDTGFEIRDVISWWYGTGFPKSLNVSKAIDEAAGAEREVISSGKAVKRMIPGADQESTGSWIKDNGKEYIPTQTIASTQEAKEWEGWGTALKPACEFWTLARKPISENNIAENVLKHHTGAINIDGCRIELNGIEDHKTEGSSGMSKFYEGNGTLNKKSHEDGEREIPRYNSSGRFPSNVIMDEFIASQLDKQTGVLRSGTVGENGYSGEYTGTIYGKFAKNFIDPNTVYGDSGGASRFFYVPKPDAFERNKGTEKLKFEKEIGHNRFDKCTNCGGTILQNPDRPSACTCEEPVRQNNIRTGNFHPTVKPIDLMRYLVRLVTPKGGLCIDPYCGSGTTLCALKLELMKYFGIDDQPEHIAIAEARVAAWNPDLYIPQTLF